MGDEVAIDLRGCSYGTLVLPGFDGGGLNDSWDLESFIRRIRPYDRAAFVFLENCLRKEGKRELADIVRYHCNLRESEQLERISLRGIWDWLHRKLTGYGTKIAPLVAGTVAFLVVGGILVIIPGLKKRSRK